jgi:hypothetical protein
VLEPTNWPVLSSNTPIIYEDEEAGEMGEANRHANTNLVLYMCLSLFLKDRHPQKRIYYNMNCYYAPGPKHKKTGSIPYVSPDNMIVEPLEPSEDDIKSYTIGKTGPEPLVTLETLSEGTAEDNDLDAKVTLYADLKVREYILVDVSGELLPQKLLLKRLQPDGTWKDERDADGGVTSALGFRLLIDEDDELVVLDAETGKRYTRLQDVPVLEERLLFETEARKQAEIRTREETRARKLAEQETREAREIAQKKSREEAEAREIAEQKTREEAEARRLAEEKILTLQAELERLQTKQND